MHKDNVSDIGELTAIKSSSAFARLLEERKIYLQSQINRFVREQNLIQSYGELCKLEDIDKLMEMVNKTIEELKKGGS